MNRVEIIGGLTRQPELRYTQGGMAVLNLTVAVNGARYDSQAREQVVTTTFVSVQTFGWLAEEIADANMNVGDEVYVLGELDQRTIEKDDGSKETKTRVTGKIVTTTRRRSSPPPRQSQGEPMEEPF